MFSVKLWLKSLALLLSAASVLSVGSPRNHVSDFSDLNELRGTGLLSPLADPYDGISYRLPNDTVPLTYDIFLSTDIHRGEFAFDGRAIIRFEVVEETEQVTMQFRMMTIHNVSLFDTDNQLIEENVAFEQNHTVEFLHVRPTQQLLVGQQYFVQVFYNATIRNDGLGFYRASYIDPEGNQVWLATTQFQANEARHAFPWYIV